MQEYDPKIQFIIDDLKKDEFSKEEISKWYHETINKRFKHQEVVLMSSQCICSQDISKELLDQHLIAAFINLMCNIGKDVKDERNRIGRDQIHRTPG